MEWLTEEACGKELWKWILLSPLAIFLCNLIMLGGMEALHISVSVVQSGSIPILSLQFPLILWYGVMIEEVIFRLPLAYCIRHEWRPGNILLAAVVLSASFGYLHGSLAHIFLQGVAGLIFSLIFLKCGGLQKHYFKALMSVTATHFLFDGALLLCVVAYDPRATL